jgi:hypothetical protein
MKQIFGVLLVIAGIAYFAFGGFHYMGREKVLDVGPLEATAEKRKEVLPYSPALGGAIVIGGLLLVVAGSRRGRQS